MNNPFRKIALFLLVIIILPIIFFTSREIISLSENESVLSEIYKKQIESLLFSLNQYSEDLIRSWSSKFEIAYIQSNNDDKKLLKFSNDTFQNIPALQSIAVSNSTNTDNYILERKEGGLIRNKNVTNIRALLQKNEQLIRKLYEYKKTNFVKIEPVISQTDRSNQKMIFILGDDKVCVMSFDKNKFIRNNLSAKIQSITANDYSIIVYDSATSRTIYSSNNSETGKLVHRSKIWLIPGYTLGIKLIGESLDDVIRGRTYSSMILIGALTLMMILFALYGYKNIKREVELVQIKNEFVSNVSHELRTPLALINMFAETLVLGRVKSEEKRSEYYSIIQHETERLSKIVNKILNFSKIEAGKWKYSFEAVDLNSLVEKIYSNYKFHLENNGFKVTFEPGNDSSP